ncbi:hypothetical protein [Clostridium sp. C2-6-12]|uniref:hypothetical protein n=1 Tax=Clostridium sp. C2-6-12 TaxID=2698832 RepID=UPI00136F2D9A|nr:hypothetical protein [Clostridium sp. C2-6-12]
MDNIDKNHRLEDGIFSYKVSKDKKVFIFWNGKQVSILKGKESEKFLSRVKNASEIDAQLVMAKATGNFKRGNEKNNKKVVNSYL